MIGVVLDTNVLVSATINAQGLEAFVVSLALDRLVQLYVSEPMLVEYDRVLHYRRLGFGKAEVARFLSRVRQAGNLVQPLATVKQAVDDADNRFLECAEAGDADYLINGNLKHFPRQWGRTKIVRARQFLEEILPQTR